MSFQVRDLAHHNPPPAVVVTDVAELRTALERFAEMSPRVVRVSPVGAGYLQVGLGGAWAFVEYCEDKPWRSEAAIPDPDWITVDPPDEVAFTCCDHESEIPGEYLMPPTRAIALVTKIVRSGRLPKSIEWESQ